MCSACRWRDRAELVVFELIGGRDEGSLRRADCKIVRPAVDASLASGITAARWEIRTAVTPERRPSTDPDHHVRDEGVGWNFQIARSRPFSDTSRGIVLGAVAGAEPAAPIADGITRLLS